jgi:hypothetical protein
VAGAEELHFGRAAARLMRNRFITGTVLYADGGHRLV